MAKLVLSDLPENPLRPDSVTIAAVRRFYFEHHVKAKINGRDVVRDKTGPKRAFALLFVYLGGYMRQNHIDGAMMVSHFSLAQQHGFMRWLRDKQGHKCKTISTYLSYIKAAMRFAATPRLITDARGREREARLLEVPFYICDGEAQVTKITGLPRSKPRDWIPTDAELAATLDQLTGEDPRRAREREPAFRYCIMALNTMARPEAITELSINAQVNFDRGFIDLNPLGRTQNSKIRPTIRLTDCLRGWLLEWNLDRPVTYYGRITQGVSNKTLAAAARRAGVAQWNKFNRYTLRHYMATRIRSVPGIQVDREHRAKQLGHTDPHHRTTEEWYESMDADYLENVRRAIDAIMLHLNTLTTRSLFAPSAIPQSRLTVVSGAPTATSDQLVAEPETKDGAA